MAGIKISDLDTVTVTNENGWALGPQMVSGTMWRPAGLNALIRTIDSLHGINTGYTVTVAPNPIVA